MKRIIRILGIGLLFAISGISVLGNFLDIKYIWKKKKEREKYMFETAIC